MTNASDHSGPGHIRNTTMEVKTGGERMQRPNRAMYSVKPGEGLSDVAANTGLSEEELRGLNNHLLGANGQPTPDMRLQI